MEQEARGFVAVEEEVEEEGGYSEEEADRLVKNERNGR